MLASAWRYRRFIISSIAADFRLRYARSRVGLFWMLAQPLAQVAIFALVLSGVLAARLPGSGGPFAYATYLLAGMLFWTLLSETVLRCLTVFIENGNLLRKISFPRVTLPIIAVGVALASHAVLMIVTILGAALMGHPPGAHLLALVPLTVLTLALATGLGIVLGALNVFARDVGQAVPVLLQIAFWLTPIVYTASILPEEYRHFVDLNPFARLATAYQQVFVAGTVPDWMSLVPVAALAVVLLVMALALVRRAGPEMADVL